MAKAHSPHGQPSSIEIDKSKVKVLTSAQLDHLAKSPIVNTLAQEDLQRALASPPFLLVPCLPKKHGNGNGNGNHDDIDNDDDDDADTSTPPPRACLNFRCTWDAERTPNIRSKRIYRCGKSDFSAADLKRLAIDRVYDLRSKVERQRDPHNADHENDAEQAGVQVIWLEPTSSMEQRADFNANSQDATSLLVGTYVAILHSHRHAFRQILLDVAHLQNGQAILLHCTAGKDRTGVAIAMLLSLAGCTDESIAKEYALTRVGIEPSRQRLIAALQQATSGKVPTDDPRFRALCESKYEDMIAFLQHVRQTYGDFEGYAQNMLELNDDQINQAKVQLRPSL